MRLHTYICARSHTHTHPSTHEHIQATFLSPSHTHAELLLLGLSHHRHLKLFARRWPDSLAVSHLSPDDKSCPFPACCSLVRGSPGGCRTAWLHTCGRVVTFTPHPTPIPYFHLQINECRRGVKWSFSTNSQSTSASAPRSDTWDHVHNLCLPAISDQSIQAHYQQCLIFSIKLTCGSLLPLHPPTSNAHRPCSQDETFTYTSF